MTSHLIFEPISYKSQRIEAFCPVYVYVHVHMAYPSTGST